LRCAGWEFAGDEGEGNCGCVNNKNSCENNKNSCWIHSQGYVVQDAEYAEYAQSMRKNGVSWCMQSVRKKWYSGLIVIGDPDTECVDSVCEDAQSRRRWRKGRRRRRRKV